MTPASSHDQPANLLLHRAKEELRRRLAAGEPFPTEQILEAFTPLSSDPDLAVQLIMAEWKSRLERGEKLDAPSWLQRFSSYRDRLIPLLEQTPGTDPPRPGTVLNSALPASAVRTTPDARTPEGGDADPALAHHLEGLPRHERLEVIDSGTMGVVYKAWDTVLQRMVALKMMHAGLFALPEEVERFQREARAAAQLDHPNIVRVFDIGEHEGRHYFTMSLATGGNLAQHRARYAEPRAAAELVEKIARAVGRAHEHGIVHRDQKPANILFDQDDQPLVADFGLAKVANSATDLTNPGGLVGTPAYMAPEQAEGRACEATPATDVWALGVILYELLTGELPFQGRNVVAMARNVVEKDPLPLRRVRPTLTRDLQSVVLKCLEKDSRRRYAHAGVMAQDLRCWLDGQPIQARPEAWYQRVGRAARNLAHRTRLAVVLTALVASLILIPSLAHSLLTWLTQEQTDSRSKVLAEIVGNLNAGRSVPFVDDVGRLRYFHRWATGSAELPSPVTKAGFATFHSIYPCLLELLPDPQTPRFRLRADVALDPDSPPSNFGTLGVYFSHSSATTNFGVEHHYYYLGI